MQKLMAIVTLLLFIPALSYALPFNDEMVAVQMRAGSIMKPKVTGSVALGSLKNRLESKEEAQSLVNPLKGDPISTANGKTLFFKNCYACHGDITRSPVVAGPVGKKMILKAPPDISSGDFKNRTDGDIYSTMYLGFGLMPRLGYKLSPTEKWDIINFIRQVQATK